MLLGFFSWFVYLAVLFICSFFSNSNPHRYTVENTFCSAENENTGQIWQERVREDDMHHRSYLEAKPDGTIYTTFSSLSAWILETPCNSQQSSTKPGLGQRSNWTEKNPRLVINGKYCQFFLCSITRTTTGLHVKLNIKGSLLHIGQGCCISVFFMSYCKYYSVLGSLFMQSLCTFQRVCVMSGA